jgi:heme exporter protein B
MALSPIPLPWLVAGKIVAHWLVCGLPVVLMAPLLGLQFDLPVRSLGLLVVSLMLGTPLLSAIGALGAALTLGLRGGGALLSLLILPLYIPALIFGAGAVEADLAGISAQGHLSLLGAILVVSVFFSPWVTSMALRIALE